jgi:hypothetical protein
MSNLKLCQGPDCHTYYTQDRFKGIKGSKTYQTRRRSNFYYGNKNFCDQRCLYDWVNKYIEQGLNHFGRTTEAKHLTEENAWDKRYRYNWERENGEAEHYYLNKITKEQRPLTEQQYDDDNYTLNIDNG